MMVRRWWGGVCDDYAKLDDRVKVLHKGNGGVSSARNAGMDIAAGSYISFVDSDDMLADDYYATLLSELGEADLIICGVTSIDAEGSLLSSNLTRDLEFVLEDNDGELLYLTKRSLLGYCWNKLYCREILEGHRFHSLSNREDAVFNLCLLKPSTRIRVLGGYAGYNWRQHPTSQTHTANGRQAENLCILCDELNKVSDASGRNDILLCCQHVARVFLYDVVIVDVLNNPALDTRDKRSAIYKLFNHKGLRDLLAEQDCHDGVFSSMLQFSLKYCLPNTFFYLASFYLKHRS